MASRPREIRELTIRNIGVIEEASVTFGSGFNVITGETGAGKTMVLTGLALLAGARADADLIRSGKERLTVSSRVAVESPVTGRLQGLMEEHQPELEGDELLLQRAVSREGKGKAIVGSDSATVGLLGDFATEFFTIHGQSTNHRLSDKRHQMALLDQSSDSIAEQLKVFRAALQAWRTRSRELEELRKATADKDAQIAALKTFLADFSRIKPRSNEWQEVTERIVRLDSVVDFTTSLSTALAALDQDDEGAIGRMGVALKALDSLTVEDRGIRDLSGRLRESSIELRDIAAEIASLLEGFDSDPAELDRLRSRKSALKQFVTRYRHLTTSDGDEQDVLEELLEIEQQRKSLLDDLENGESRLEGIEQECRTLLQDVAKEASALRTQRREAAANLSDFVNSELANLGLKGARFDVGFHEIPLSAVTIDGLDEIEFLFAAHSSGSMLPLNKGISGGELSRVMLAVELALRSKEQNGSLIFDEIDAGIGGETGLLIGERLSKLADHRQIIVITHLAQVAAWADRHFRIEKDEKGEYVLSSVIEVEGEDRVEEIARMLSGQSNLQAARDHARELLKHAEN